MYRGLEITTTVGCAVNCRYCPQDVLRDAYPRHSGELRMSLDTFVRCLETVPPDVNVHFSGFSEPWQNPECSEMVRHAHRRGHPITVFTTAVGMRLSDVEVLRALDFEKFRVHLPDDRGSMRITITASYLRVLETLLASGLDNLGFVCPGVAGPQAVHPQVRDVITRNGARLDEEGFYSRPLISRAGAVSHDLVLPLAPKRGPLKKCPFLTKNVLLPDGRVVLCCMDYAMRHTLGNLLRHDYRSLHTGAEFRRIIEGLEQDDSDAICRRCELAECETTRH